MSINQVPCFTIVVTTFVFAGAGTALMGKEAAMACTVAVETVIGEHYNSQIRNLLEEKARQKQDTEDDGVAGTETEGDKKEQPHEDDDLIALLAKNRDEELEHLDTAMENDAELAPGYQLLSTIIKTGCKAAVQVAKVV